jgi:hypothetical protein
VELEAAFHRVVEIANDARTASEGLRELVGCLRPSHGILRHLAALDIEADVAAMRVQLQALVRSEPVPQSVNAMWFGLFDLADESVGYYVAGIEGYDPQCEEALSKPRVWPTQGYLRSDCLEAIKQAEFAARIADETASADLIAYAGQLGIALLLARFSSAGLFGKRHRIVGFDSGDFAEVAD